MTHDNTRYYVIDSETTGIDTNAAACEIGFIEIDEDFNILQSQESIIDPQQLISPAASGIHGLTNKDCETYPTIAEWFSADDPSCYGKPLAGPAVLIGHKVAFDVRFLGEYVDGPFTELCSLRWARRLYPDSDNHQLSTLKFALDLPREGTAHRVMADIMATYWLTRHICDRTNMTLPQLAEASLQPMEVQTVPFGKWKGTPFAKTPRSYLRWMSENMADLDMDTRYTLSLQLK